MDNELALRLFVSVVEGNSFSKGGARLGVPQSSTSRMITKMETQLGAKLLRRSTRNLTLTEAGQIYFEHASRIVAGLDEAKEAIRNLNGAPAGLLRVTAPATFGRRYIAPMLKEFHTLYPDITIGLSLNDAVEDIIGLGYDVAIRLGELRDSNLIGKRLASSTSLICASPEYLKEYGTPKTVEDLAEHNCLQFRRNPGQNTWRFVKGGSEHSVQVKGSFFANNGDALLVAALTGLGISFAPEWVLAKYIKDGRLCHILPEFSPKVDLMPIQAVYGYRQFVPAKQRVFIEFLQVRISAMSWNKG